MITLIKAIYSINLIAILINVNMKRKGFLSNQLTTRAIKRLTPKYKYHSTISILGLENHA